MIDTGERASNSVGITLASTAESTPAVNVVERELAELRAEVTRARALAHVVRAVNARGYGAKHTLGRADRDLFESLARVVADYDAVALPLPIPDPADPEVHADLPAEADYDRAIYHLEVAKRQLVPDGNSCRVCGDSGHQAFECPHNPMVVLRAVGLMRERARTLHEALHGVGDLLGYL